MSVMSAAEAGRAGGSGPDLPVPRRRLEVATPPGQDREQDTEIPPGAGSRTRWRPAAGGDPAQPGPGTSAEVRSTELHVSEVRIVRRASVRLLRTGVSRAAPAGPGAAPARAGVAAQTRVVAARASAVAQTRVVASRISTATRAGTDARDRTASATRAATRSRMAAQASLVARTRVAATTRTAGQRPQRPGAIRLTRRGRRVVAGLAVLAVIAAATLLWMTAAGSVQASSRGGSPASPYQGMTQVVVRPGQTLWSIAAAAQPSANAWSVVQQITEVNALSGPTVHAGQLLWVPKG
jgi:hypothetical protein